MQTQTSENILNPLPQEFQILQQRLNLHHIPFEAALFHNGIIRTVAKY
jgi:hypothetical protein